MVASGDFVEIMGSVFGNREIGSKPGDAIWWNDLANSFACANISLRKRR